MLDCHASSLIRGTRNEKSRYFDRRRRRVYPRAGNARVLFINRDTSSCRGHTPESNRMRTASIQLPIRRSASQTASLRSLSNRLRHPNDWPDYGDGHGIRRRAPNTGDGRATGRETGNPFTKPTLIAITVFVQARYNSRESGRITRVSIVIYGTATHREGENVKWPEIRNAVRTNVQPR